MDFKKTLKEFSVALAISFVITILFVIGASIAFGVTILPGQQGGTGYSSTTAGNADKALLVSSTNPITYKFGTAGGGGGTTTTIAGLQPATDIFIFNSTSGIAIGTSSPAT